MMDFSGSLHSYYRTMVQFVRHVIYGLDFRYDRTRLALAAYAEEIRVRTVLCKSLKCNSKQESTTYLDNSTLTKPYDKTVILFDELKRSMSYLADTISTKYVHNKKRGIKRSCFQETRGSNQYSGIRIIKYLHL